MVAVKCWGHATVSTPYGQQHPQKQLEGSWCRDATSGLNLTYQISLMDMTRLFSGNREVVGLVMAAGRHQP